jgi:D-serine deaminase-like pyridoxal phosphate-dependent protein
MSEIREIETPALLVDLGLLEANLARGAEVFAGRGLAYRPHAKTHKSAAIARKQLEHGAAGICCAKLAEAEVLAAAGINDILITTPVVGGAKIARLADLNRRIRAAVVVDDPGNAREIAAAAARAGVVVDVLVEVDVGQERCGVRTPEAAVVLARTVETARGLRFRGLQGYQGAGQLVRLHRERRAAVERASARLRLVVAALAEVGLTTAVLTGGGTGTAALDVEAGVLTELQPGSYVFMDASYGALEWEPGGAAPPFAQSLTVLSRVISRPSPRRVVVDAGLKALSSDAGPPLVMGLDSARFSFAGDEHGIVELDDADAPALGEAIELVPSHCDTTVNLHDTFVVVRAGEVECTWPIDARGRMQ